MTDWDAYIRDLKQYSCACGSGGPMACDDDCPGDLRDTTMIEVIEAVRALERQVGQWD